MPCDTRLKPRQTISQRAAEIKKITEQVARLLAESKVKAKVDRATGAVAFEGLTDDVRDGATDACIYRRIMVSGGALAKAKLAQAEALAGRSVNKQALAQGVHSHDGGKSWHNGH